MIFAEALRGRDSRKGITCTYDGELKVLTVIDWGWSRRSAWVIVRVSI